MEIKHKIVPVVGFKLDEKTGEFECYANVKGVVDHAKDRSMNGCFVKSISEHEANGTRPKMLWSHNPRELPVGTWVKMIEDEKGLRMTGKLSKTTMGRDIETLAKDMALDSFSIGYEEIESKWNSAEGCNDVFEYKIHEVSWVNFACNEPSKLESIKQKMASKEMPTKRDLQKFLQEYGMSKSEASAITDKYNPDSVSEKQQELEIIEAASKLDLFSK